MGLQLVLDQHTNLDSLQTVHEPGLGLKVLVSQPGAFPLLGQDSLLLAPGQSHNLRLDATVVRSTKAVASLNEMDRECVFPGERDLQHHSVYSQERNVTGFKLRYKYFFCFRHPVFLSVDLPTQVKLLATCLIRKKQILCQISTTNCVHFKSYPTLSLSFKHFFIAEIGHFQQLKECPTAASKFGWFILQQTLSNQALPPVAPHGFYHRHMAPPFAPHGRLRTSQACSGDIDDIRPGLEAFSQIG